MPAAQQHEMTLRVLTINIQALAGLPQDGRLAVLQQGLADLNPDLVALQEVGAAGQLGQVLGTSGLHAHFDRELLGGGVVTLGTALVSRWQPRTVIGHLLPGPRAAAYPTAITAAIPLPIGLDMHFIAACTSWRLEDEAVRCRQVLALADLDAAMRQAAPTVIAGDFTAAPGQDCMRFLTGQGILDGRSVHYRDTWELAGDGGPGYTFTTGNPVLVDVQLRVPRPWIQHPHHRRIDYVLVASTEQNPLVSSAVTSSRVVFTEPPVSDHYGVLSEIRLARVDPPEATPAPRPLRPAPEERP